MEWTLQLAIPFDRHCVGQGGRGKYSIPVQTEPAKVLYIRSQMSLEGYFPFRKIDSYGDGGITFKGRGESESKFFFYMYGVVHSLFSWTSGLTYQLLS